MYMCVYCLAYLTLRLLLLNIFFWRNQNKVQSRVPMNIRIMLDDESEL